MKNLQTLFRKGFETNSSSTHTICISKDGPITKQELFFKEDGFGWEVERYCDVQSKTAYLYTAMKDLPQFDTVLSFLKEEGIDYDVELDGEGYIDHSEKLDKFLCAMSDKEKLLQFLFGNSVIYTGNDNDGGYRVKESKKTHHIIKKGN